MTREQAIEWIRSLVETMHYETNGGLYPDPEYRDEVYEALDMAIRALEQEPCEDCISRQAVDTLVDELARAISDERCCISRGRSTATIMRDIFHLPPVTPQQKTGRWLSHKEYCEKHDLIPSGLVTLEWCSNCDFGIDINEMHGKHYKYCPMCGEKKEV